MKVQVMFRKLFITKEQQEQIADIYNRRAHFVQEYAEDCQQEATELLFRLGLDQESRKDLESRWSIRNSSKSGDSRRTLFQCGCGYDSVARQKQEEARNIKRGPKDWERQTPYPFTACLAHVEVIEKGNGIVSWIAGVLDHNDACKASLLERRPPVPLHEHVYEVALGQLKDGASITVIQDKNREMIESKLYRGMANYEASTANVRYLFLPSDHASLYRKATKNIGMDARQLPQDNVEDWLNPNSPGYRSDIAKAIFHYSARIKDSDRFEICISTPEMDEAAQKYAHHSQFILDGTFGICSSRILLFIALALVDEDCKGVPVALFLFSASTKAKATHASYDTAILTRLLTAWKTTLEHKFGSFEPYSCITDTDTKERGAIIAIWPHIILLICKFHLRQCWTNSRKKLFRFNGPEYWKDLVRNTLYTLEVQLISSVEHASAIALIHTQRAFLQQVLENRPEGKRSAEAGIEHLRYLEEFWMKLSLWQSWSEWGRLAAAAAIKIPVEGIIPTTNHLESFNMVLKKKYIQQHLHSGHRLRFDLLIILLVTDILPKVYSRRRAIREHTSWLDARFFEGAGAQNLSELQRKLAASRQEQARILRNVCWWDINIGQDERAREILQVQRIHAIDNTQQSLCTFVARCKSSQPNIEYHLSLSQTGAGSCTCPKFYNDGGACKHLRAFRFIIDGWISRGLCPPFEYPSSLSLAQNLQASTSGHTLSGVANLPDLPPSVPVKESTLDYWTRLQALGKDPTILGGLEDGEEGLTRNDEVNTEDGDEDESDGQTVRSLPHLRVYLFIAILQILPNIYTNHRDAVDAQIAYRVTQDISSILPRLHGLDMLIKEATDLTEASNLVELKQVLTSLLGQISAHTQTESHTSLQTASTTLPTSTSLVNDADSSYSATHQPSGRYKRAYVRAPSPEEKQKRKKSHGTL
ncbi:hypothetical protein F5880DRAFT_1489367 [Lentinula raphanica]|nr:hypothetical protein F5880DRAFT_1489367 [Lentinula raphanica]